MLQVLAERMDYWNHDPGADAINRVRGAVADVKSVMIENIEKARVEHDLMIHLADSHLPFQADGIDVGSVLQVWTACVQACLSSVAVHAPVKKDCAT